MTTSLSSFGVTVFWDVAAFLGCLLIFNILRQTPFTKRMYAPKRYIEDSQYAHPKELPGTYSLTWIKPLLQYTEEDILRIAGFDAAAYLRIFSFGIRLFLILSVFNLLVVLPVNITDDRVDILQRVASGNVTKKELKILQKEDEAILNDTRQSANDFGDGEKVTYKIGSFDKLSMTNVNPGSPRLWAHFVSVWFITIVTLKLLWQYHQKAANERIRFMATRENGAEAHTVLVTDIPGIEVGTPLDALIKTPIFKYLPKRVRNSLQASIEQITALATQGVGAAADFSANVTKNITAQLQPMSRPHLKGIKNRRMLRKGDRRMSLRCVRKDENFNLIQANDVTDMNPREWTRSRLVKGMSLEEVVFQQFKEVYPEGLVRCAHIVTDTSVLTNLMTDYETAFQNLEDLVDHYRQKVNRGALTIKTKTKRVVPLVEGKWAVEEYGINVVEAELISYYLKKLEYLKTDILREREEAQGNLLPSAFVTFKTRWAQTISSTAFHHHFPTNWSIRAAPSPEEIIWKNLRFRGWERTIRKVQIWVEFSLLCLFFFIPVTFVQGLIQMDRLEKYPVIGPIVTYPLINGFLKGVVPNLALKLFLAILPIILRNMCMRQGLISLSEVDFEVVRKYFIFQTITVFFLSFITNSLLGQIDELRRNPSSIKDILGIAAPQAATFFISYILYGGLFEGGISFLNLINLAKLWVLEKLASTEKAKARVWMDQTMEYGTEVPNHTLTILLGLAFSVINPIVLPVCLLYFVAMKIMWLYNMMYIYSEEYQSGGKLWDQVFEHVITGLLIHQLMMIGLFAIKSFPYLALLIPLPVITVIFRMIVHHLYDKPLQILSLRAAHDLDVADREVDLESDDLTFDRYKHPAFMIDWEELEDLMKHAKNISKTIEALSRN